MFYILDMAIAICIPLAVYAMRAKNIVSKDIWLFFWLGLLIGATWEFGFHFTGPEYSSTPSYTQTGRFPIHPILQPISHSLWDAGLFLIGVFLVYRSSPSPMQSFSVKEAATLTAWGLSQAMVIELAALASPGGWSFTISWWNPALIQYGDKALTLAPLAIWGVASIAYYLIAITYLQTCKPPVTDNSLPLHRGSIL